VFKELIREEGIMGLSKGLSARIATMMPSSLLITLGYETIKKLSLRKDLVESGEFKIR
jgi:solute carrier family 25 protein 44